MNARKIGTLVGGSALIAAMLLAATMSLGRGVYSASAGYVDVDLPGDPTLARVVQGTNTFEGEALDNVGDLPSGAYPDIKVTGVRHIGPDEQHDCPLGGPANPVGCCGGAKQLDGAGRARVPASIESDAHAGITYVRGPRGNPPGSSHFLGAHANCGAHSPARSGTTLWGITPV